MLQIAFQEGWNFCVYYDVTNVLDIKSHWWQEASKDSPFLLMHFQLCNIKSAATLGGRENMAKWKCAIWHSGTFVSLYVA